MTEIHDPFGARRTIDTPLGERVIYRLDALDGLGDVEHLPYSIKVLLESALRNHDGRIVTDDDVHAAARYDATAVGETEIAFKPARVVLQDFTGVPAVVDLAAMRSAVVRMTGNETAAAKVNPQVPADLVVDHSVQVDAFNSPNALRINSEIEFERNMERYEFLKWGQAAFDDFRVVPPATGIVHQVNLEYLAKVVWDHAGALYPDSLVGTDSHTTMINGLGVVGWGVGGIEAEAVMVGQPIYMLLPEVVGFRLTGVLPDGATATDLVLRITEMLREHGVVGKFVEYFGPALDGMPVANRATIANMAPEYGATVGFFPVDDQVLDYLRLSGRDEALISTVEQYYREQGMWRDESRPIAYSSLLELDLGTIVPSLAGPTRPQDRIDLDNMKTQWHTDLEGGLRPDGAVAGTTATVTAEDETFELGDGDVVIAAITSCTNTSNPDVMIGAGLVARKANERGLTRKPWVKTSLAPGSKVVTDYLVKAGLLDDLEAVGFWTVGYGCTTCIGNSGPLPGPIAAGVEEADLVVTSVLSGNRNFEGRISPHVRANYLASPPLVVAYAMAGTVDIDLSTEPLGVDQDGADVYLADLWPTQEEVAAVVASSVNRDQFTTEYGAVFDGSEEWRAVDSGTEAIYDWNPDFDVCPGTAVLRRSCTEPDADHADRRGARPAEARRLGDDRSHQPGRSDRRRHTRGPLPHGAGRRAGDVQQLRLAARQRSGHDPRHVRECPSAEPTRARNRGRLDARLPRRRGQAGLRRLDALPGRGCAARRARRQGLRNGFVARLGGEGDVPARRQGRDRRELRAHPPVESRDDGCAAVDLHGRGERETNSVSTARRCSHSMSTTP